jgi:beta-lactam-binding protein with PASTA domain/tRNA A-37 threonylcarbamoyl transferase component Bud32
MTQVANVFSNRYEIQRGIARGGMAQVYLARDQLLDRPVAIKVLFPEFARDPSFVERFRREAQAAANLNHPNIVGIYDWGQERGTYFIVMEYVEGRSLRDVIRADGALPPAQAAEIGAEIAGALAFAHRNGVVHRDVKPGNVLLTAAGRVKVTDFGIARATQGSPGDALTLTGAVMGTATYFSPEQAQGLPVDGRSDVYSLGVVLFEMLTGEPPFRADNAVAMATAHVREEAPRARDLEPDVPHDLDEIVTGAMIKDVDARYQSADDLRDDLVRFGRGRPPAALPVTAALAEVPTGAGATAGRTEAMPAAETVPAGGPPGDDFYPRPRRRWGTIIAGVVGLTLLAAAIIFLLVSSGDRNGASAARIDVPNVVGQDFDAAKALLEGEGFEVRRVDETSAEAANLVLRQEPPEGRKLEEGGTVRLFVSEAEVEVPDNLVGQQCLVGIQELQRIGLAGSCQDEDSDEPAGTVLRTDPPAGTPVAKGGNVTLVQARQPDIPVPDVANQPAAAAKELLEQSGFVVTTANEPSVDVPAGWATRTDPPAATPLKRGDALTMFISTGPERVEVPDVRNLTQEEAQNQLIIRAFNVIVQPQMTNNPQQVGRVISQNPSGGQAEQGSTVTITVGQQGQPPPST